MEPNGTRGSSRGLSRLRRTETERPSKAGKGLALGCFLGFKLLFFLTSRIWFMVFDL